ncbi:MAG: hypothetical protein KKC77_13150 [Proteobacteria bacterium]|nr:hypothetical protein [Pseudomonadota bacterium]
MFECVSLANRATLSIDDDERGAHIGQKHFRGEFTSGAGQRARFHIALEVATKEGKMVAKCHDEGVRIADTEIIKKFHQLLCLIVDGIGI